jgi:glycosyltransferase involved in cell wall biosynthesis
VRIIGVIENDCSAGGGYFQGLNAIIQMNDICIKNGIIFEVVIFSESSISFFEEKNIIATQFKKTIFDRIIHRILSVSIIQNLLELLKFNWIYPIERRFNNLSPDLLYFISPSSIPIYLKKINFIYTVWDLCHRDFPEFPEVRNSVFHLRENKYKYILPFASLIVVDSEVTKNNIANYYGVSKERVLELPFSPNPFLSKISNNNLVDPLTKLCINHNFIFYPAQFWPHKNHISILKAIKILNSQGVKINVVFVGGNKGNKQNIHNFIYLNELSNQVKIYDFVTSEDLNLLYSGCSAVIMPSFFGPTNLLPLEAWYFDKPIIYSDLFFEQVQNAAILVNPFSPQSIAEGILSSMDEKIRENVIREGTSRLEFIETEIQNSIKKIENYILKYRELRDNWSI